MEKYEENQEPDKYGNVTFGEASQLLIDTIGQNVILDYISKNTENEQEAEKNERHLEDIWNECI